jgi:hypothetical protein
MFVNRANGKSPLKINLKDVIKLMLLLFGCLFTVKAMSQDWPQWRGQNRDGIATDCPLRSWPVTGPKLLWKSDFIPANLEGGYGSVSIADDGRPGGCCGGWPSKQPRILLSASHQQMIHLVPGTGENSSSLYHEKNGLGPGAGICFMAVWIVGKSKSSINFTSKYPSLREILYMRFPSSLQNTK